VNSIPLNSGARPPRRGRASAAKAVAVAATLLLGGGALAGCGLGRVAHAVHTATHRFEHNKHVVDEFTAGLKSSGSTTFAATYETTGQSADRVVYAVDPARHAVSFREVPGGGTTSGRSFLLANAAGEYSCSPPSSGSRWTCEKLGHGTGFLERQAVGLYTPSHWVGFLHGISLAAGFAGEKVTQSRLTEHGFALRCVDFKTPGVSGRSRVCTTAQGILGYVQVASDSASFEITGYTAAPAPSLFRLPAGAKITRVRTGSR
jgi:hypothetical protein